MKFIKKNPPREFTAGKVATVVLKDCGEIYFEPNEQITFKTPDGGEYDVARKNWGFYATPSLNDRLISFGFKSALVKNSQGKLYIMLVESGKMQDFLDYIKEDKQTIVEWLDERAIEKTHSD